MDPQLLAGLGVQDGPGDPAVPRGLVDIGLDKLGGVRRGVVVVEVLAIDKRVERGRRDLGRLHPADLVPHSVHRISAVPPAARDRGERAIPAERLDPEEDVPLAQTLGHCAPSSQKSVTGRRRQMTV
jgi:hypothetical protein